MTNTISGKEPMLPVRQYPKFKFKDRPNRNRIIIDFKKSLGFLPERIILDKVMGENNAIVLSAILTDEEIKHENDRQKNKGVVRGEKKTSGRVKSNG